MSLSVSILNSEVLISKIKKRKENLLDSIKDKEEKLKEIKEKIQSSNDFYRPIYNSFNFYKKFLYETNYSSNEMDALSYQGVPPLEFNQIGSFTSRLLGEFYKYDPSASICPDDDFKMSNNDYVIKNLEYHLNHDLNSSYTKKQMYDAYKNLLCGMSCFKIFTEYKNKKSIDHVIKIQSKDPTMCGFDPCAKEQNKQDGNFCFEKFIYSKEEFNEEFPDENFDEIKNLSSIEDTSWNFYEKKKKYVCVYDYYEKKSKKITMYYLSNGNSMQKKDYLRMVEFQKVFRRINNIPTVVDKKTYRENYIERYRIVSNKILSYEKTDYKDLPYVFIGRTEAIKDSQNSNIREIIIPYFKNAIGSQKFINYAGSKFANAIENSVQSKWIIAEEALPTNKDYLNQWLDPQRSGILIYKSFVGDKPIQSPQPAITKDMPPEIAQAFSSGMNLMQSTLGSFDASLGINDNQLSGIAISEGATQSNAAAMPYIATFLMGMEYLYEIYFNLFSIFYSNKRIIPIINGDGQKDFTEINSSPDNTIKYDSGSIGIKIKIGASSTIEKNKSFNMMVEASRNNPAFAQFLNNDCMDVFLMNLDFKGSEIMQSRYPQFKQQQAQAQQQAVANNPLMVKNQIEMQKLKLDEQKHNDHLTLDAMDLKKETQKMIMQANQAQMEQFSKMMEQQTKQMVAMLELKKELVIHDDNHTLAKKEMVHRHLGDAIDRHHKISKENSKEELTTEKEIEDDSREKQNSI
ncbi:MAG: hypothetical protein E6R13_00640 [Spirochaetes bacterium]|nr:MAG: hypothetical protein E6R13_00640 [Spirochaetota bacterium]